MEGDQKRISASISDELEDDESARDKMAKIRKLQLPDIFVEQSINLEADEREETAMSFSDRGDNMLFVALGDKEGQIECTLSMDFEHKNIFENLMENLSNMMPEAEMNNFVITAILSDDFEDMTLPITSENNYDVEGVRISKNGIEYGVQKTDDGMIHLMSRFSLGKLKSIEFDSLVDEKEEKLDSFLEEIK